MKTYYLWEMSFKEINKFLDWLEKTDEAQIYINSGGGKCWEFQCVTDRLNRMVEQGYNISLRCVLAGSRAFHLFYHFKGKCFLEWDAEGIVHVDAREGSYFFDSGIAKERTSDVYDIGREEYDKAHPLFVYPFLTEEEVERYRKWRDIYLNPDRMKEIFDK